MSPLTLQLLLVGIPVGATLGVTIACAIIRGIERRQDRNIVTATLAEGEAVIPGCLIGYLTEDGLR